MLSKIASVKLNSTSLFFIVSGLLKDWGDEPEIVSENDEKIKKSNQIHYWISPEISQQINHFLLNLNQKPIFPSKRKLEANWKEREREREREREGGRDVGRSSPHYFSVIKYLPMLFLLLEFVEQECWRWVESTRLLFHVRGDEPGLFWENELSDCIRYWISC